MLMPKILEAIIQGGTAWADMQSMLESRTKQLLRMARGRKGERKRLCTSSLELTSAWQALYIKRHIERLTGPHGVC